MGSRETALALRLFALAIACACGCLVDSVVAHPSRFIAGVVVGAALALFQDLLLRRHPRVAGPALLLPHIAVWTWLVSVSGGMHSPLVAGYLFEVPLAGVLMGRLGVAVAAIVAAAAIAITSRLGPPVTSWSSPAAAIGFVGIAAVLTSWLLGVVERQRREIATSHEALRQRADGLADELRLLGDYVSGGLLTIDDLGRVVRLNPAGAAILGLEPGAASGLAWQQVLRPAGSGADALVTAITGAGEARGLELLIGTAGDRFMGLDADVWTGTSIEGRRTYVLFSAATAAESEGTDPLRRLGEAAASVSHQIKNSLHALQGFARQLPRDPRPDQSGAFAADQLQHALGTLAELAEDVLAMSGAPRAEEAVPLETVLANAVTLARRSGVRIEVRRCAGGEPEVRAHRGRLVHALFNLIDNACRVTPESGAVEISVGACPDTAWVEICDRGPGPPGINGTPPRELARGPFTPPGHGVGLIATRRFLESFGACLEFLPREGGGARCRVRLARFDTAAAAALRHA